MSEPLIITKPGRMVSFDETHLFLTGKENVGRKKMLVVKDARGSADRDMVVNKCAANLTQVGGSCADGRALPQLAIIPGKSIDPMMTKGAPASCFIDPSTEAPRSAVYSCNDCGGMTDDMGPVYLDKVIFPCMQPTEENPIVLICDGHGSHLTYEFLQKCHGGGTKPKMFLVLRPPHTSHRLQCEDVVNFAMCAQSVL